MCPVCGFLHFLFRRLHVGARRSPSWPLIATRSPTVICAPAFASWCLAMTEFRAECRLKTFVVCSFSPSPSSQRPLIGNITDQGTTDGYLAVQRRWIGQSTNTNDSVTSPSSLRLIRLSLSCNYDVHLVHISSISRSKTPHSKTRQSRPLQWVHVMQTTGQQLLGNPSSQRLCVPSKSDAHSSLQSPTRTLHGETRWSRLLQTRYITQAASDQHTTRYSLSRDTFLGAATPLLPRSNGSASRSSCPSHKLRTVSWHRIESGCGFVRVRKWPCVCALRMNGCCVCGLTCLSCEHVPPVLAAQRRYAASLVALLCFWLPAKTAPSQKKN